MRKYRQNDKMVCTYLLFFFKLLKYIGIQNWHSTSIKIDLSNMIPHLMLGENFIQISTQNLNRKYLHRVLCKKTRMCFSSTTSILDHLGKNCNVMIYVFLAINGPQNCHSRWGKQISGSFIWCLFDQIAQYAARKEWQI